MSAVAIGLASYKGGTGKTTLSWNLAERAQASGLAVQLADLDYQEGAGTVAALRETDRPAFAVVRVPVSAEGSHQLTELLANGDGVVVCDFPGAEDPLTARLINLMDLVLCPVGSSPLDLSVAGNFADDALNWKWPAYFVGSNLPQGRLRRQQMQDELGQYGLAMVPRDIYGRVAYRDSLIRGLGVCEYAPAGKAAEEMRGLWRWVAAHLKLDTKREA